MGNGFEEAFWEIYDRAEELALQDPEWRFLEEQIHHALDKFAKVEGLQDMLVSPIDKQYLIFMKKIYEVLQSDRASDLRKMQATLEGKDFTR